MLKPGTKLGKYRIQKKLGEGGYATVYKAYDNIEGVSVALKIPHTKHVSDEALEDFRKEVRLVARLDHPNILHLKNASIIDDTFVIVYPLGTETLGDRMGRRMSFKKMVDYTDQMLEALAYAHDQRVVHCDIKPDNFILFAEEDRLRLSDFGIAKIALATRTLLGSGAGTVGYLAPEQAMGQPSFRSDVFSMALVLYRMYSGELPTWPFEWPLVGYERIRGRLHPELIALLQRSLDVDARKRPADGVQLQAAFERIRPKVLRYATRKRKRRSRKPKAAKNWRTIQLGEFRRLYGKALEVKHTCKRCGGPFGERMLFCPWCGTRRKKYDGPTSFPERCTRCGRGMKKDWRFCAWCYGAGYEPDTSRTYSDKRYSAKCTKCKKKVLMPFMRYCPNCRTKVRRSWKIPKADKDARRCTRCGWDVLPEFWDHCPWCGKGTGR